MITTSTTLKTHLTAEVTTLALCWKVVRKDGVTSGFTSFSRDLVVDGITYKASTGFTPTAIETSAGLAVDQFHFERHQHHRSGFAGGKIRLCRD
jgi:hypothetical protein